MIIAFTGRAGSGKDYQANILKDKGFIKLAFADSLREIAAKTLGMDLKYVLDNYDYLKSTNLVNNLNFRHILENLGSSIRAQSEEFLINCLINRIAKNLHMNYCISDLRYPNEFKKLSSFCESKGIEFKCVFCNFRSHRYQEINNHESARFSNYLSTIGLNDLELVSEDHVKEYEEYNGQ